MGLFTKKSAMDKKYKLAASLRTGNFSKVHRATRRSDGAVVAIKIIDKALVDSLEDVKLHTSRCIKNVALDTGYTIDRMGEIKKCWRFFK